MCVCAPVCVYVFVCVCVCVCVCVLLIHMLIRVHARVIFAGLAAGTFHVVGDVHFGEVSKVRGLVLNWISVVRPAPSYAHHELSAQVSVEVINCP